MLRFDNRFVIKKTLLGKNYIGNLEDGTVMIINETAAYILNLLSSGEWEIDALVAQLAVDFAVSKRVIYSDIKELIDKMLQEGVLHDM